MKLIAGLDIGTTGCKVTVFDETGANLGREYRDYPVKRQTTAQEVDAEALRDGVFAVLSAAAKRFGAISGMGVTSFGEAFVVTDGEGRPLRPVMLCTDPRGAEECAELVAKVGAQELMRITGVKASETYSLPKLLWIKRHEPELFAKAKYVMLVEDYVIYLLTGLRRIDYSLATRSMAFDLETLGWSEKILGACGIDPAMFSEPVATGSVAGTVSAETAAATGLDPAMKVIASGHDQVAAAVGAGVFEPGTAVDGAGTVECVTPVYEKIPEDRAFQENNYNVAPYFGKYVAYAYSYTGGALVQWCTNLLGKGHAELQEGDYAPTGLLLLPHFAGAATPYMDSGSKGAIVGLSLATTPRDLYLACLEGVAYEMRVNQERLVQSGVVYRRLVATGGGAKSKLWMQIKADVLGVPVTSLETEDAGTVGSAMMTGVATGVFADLDAARRTMVREVATFTPDPARKAEYDKIFARYAKLYDAVRPLA